MNNDQQIEAMARSLVASNPNGVHGWDYMSERSRVSWKRRVSAALAAVHPTITTVAELDALPDETVIRDSDTFVFERQHLAHDPSILEWHPIGIADSFGSHVIELPATVLYWGQA